MKKIILLVLTLNALLYAKPTMSQKSYEMLMTAQKHIEENKIVQAKEILNKLLKKNNNYVKSYAYQYLANISLGNNDYIKTQEYYEQIIELNSFEKNNINRIKLSLSKIYLSLEKFDKSIQLSKDLLKTSKVEKESIYETLIYSYYYTKDYKNSLYYNKEYIKIAKEKKENIYQILYSSYIELKDYPKAISTLNIMIKQWHAQQNYWLQLISLYQETKQYKKALSTIELSYKKDVLDPNKNTQFYVNLLLQNNLFQKGSLALENGIKNGYIKEDKKSFELLISAYLSAKEFNKAIAKLSSSKYAKNEKFKKILANLHYKKHNYKSTISILKTIPQKTKKQFDPDIQILLSLCYYELNDIKNTTKHLKKVYHSKNKKRAMGIAKSLQIKL